MAQKVHTPAPLLEFILLGHSFIPLPLHRRCNYSETAFAFG